MPADADALTDLAHASKAHWGYPRDWIEAWRESLTLTREYVATHRVVIGVERAGAPIGFYALVERANGTLDLDHLFVDPRSIGRGVGRLLFDDAVASARELGYTALEIDSDPFAAGFYGMVGAKLCGVVAAPMPGEGPDGPGRNRTRPQYRMDLTGD